MPDRRLLLVHAHPDDESIFTGLTMAKYAAEGAAVTLVTCTRGELGEIVRDDLAHLTADELGAQREAELAEAAALLGVTEHRFLGDYRDSGMQWAPDGTAVALDNVEERAFWRAELAEAADALVAVIREVRPQVLVTYDPHGGYGHPDHIQAHRVATRAAELAAVATHRADLGPGWQVTRTLWCADPQDADIVIDAPEWAGVKLAAMRAHRTQIAEGSRFLTGGVEAVAAEGYLVAGGPVPEGQLSDLFAGIVHERT